MLAIERKNEILDKLRAEQRVLVSDLAEYYNVTEETIRRDLDKLEKEGYATKTYGGAILGNSTKTDLSYTIRNKTNVDAKNQIAALASRLIEDGEAEVLNASAITAADDPLLTAVQYQSKNQPMPTVSALLGASIDRYAKQSAATAANRGSSQTASDSADTSTDLSQAASEMQQRTDALIASADKLMAGLTDVAGSANATETDLNKGAEGSLPEQTVTVDQIANANPTPAPADSTADGSDSTENGDTTPDTPGNSGDNNTNNGGTSAEGETINVTMNGTAQTMDLVRCLAMVAQNELGSSAPAEAYKALKPEILKTWGNK